MKGQGSGTGVTTGAHLCNRFKWVLIVRLELPNRSTIIRRVVGGTNANGTVLRFSHRIKKLRKLFLTYYRMRETLSSTENHQFS